MLGLRRLDLIAALVGITGLIGSSSAASASASLFDKPLKTVHLALPRDPDNPNTKAELACFYYPHFVIKQIDLGEVDAEQLSIIPKTGKGSVSEPACRRQNVTNERVIAARDWSGYFKGVKGDYVFFDAGDGWNGGLGFAVFAPDAKKIMEDAAKTWTDVELTPIGIALKYTRVFAAKCSLRIGEAACWTQIKHDTGLTNATPPDCAAAYAREQKRVPKFSKQTLADPTVIDYEALVTIYGRAHNIAPVTGKAIACRPAD